MRHSRCAHAERKRRSSTSVVLLAAIAAALGVACVSIPDPDLVSVHVTPVSPFVTPGTSIQLVATGIQRSGEPLDLSNGATWQAANDRIVVDSTGLVTGVREGTSAVEIVYQGFVMTVPVRVSVAPIDELDITLNAARAHIGLSIPLGLTAGHRDGGVRDVTDEAGWTASDTAIAIIQRDSAHQVDLRPRRPGRVRITASHGGLVATSTVDVVRRAPTAGPLRVSSDNPRYFADSLNRIVFLTGSHYWYTLQDRAPEGQDLPFDYDRYMDFLTRYGHNFVRLWTHEQTKDSVSGTENQVVSPHPFRRTGPGLANDGLPKFDLTQFDPAYFGRMRQRIADAGRRGIYVSVMLFNGWSIETKPGWEQTTFWQFHPFNRSNNVNEIDGDPNGTGSGVSVHTLGDTTVFAVQMAYIRQVVSAVGHLDNVLYEISNESRDISTDWQYAMIEGLRKHLEDVGQERPVGMTFQWPGGTNAALEESPADWISPSYELETPPIANGSKVIVADTDHLCGICGSTSWVWKSVTQGQYPMLMDGYRGTEGEGHPSWNPTDPVWEGIRKNLGYARALTDRFDLAKAVPRPQLASTGYCLALEDVPGYLVFVPIVGEVTVDLSATAGTLRVEWLNPANGRMMRTGSVEGGAPKHFTAPFAGDAVLLLDGTGAS